MKFSKIAILMAILLLVALVGCETKEQFNVKFVDYDGTVLSEVLVDSGEEAKAPGDPARDNYTFIGWDQDFTNVISDLEVVAVYEINKFTITWKNDDGTVLLREEYEYGKMPTYSKSVPVKEGSKGSSYVFKGWLPLIEIVTQDQEYVVDFDEKHDEFTITWKNFEGELLLVEEYEYGQMPVYKLNTPSKSETKEFSYEFVGWDMELSPVYENKEYTAQFSETRKKYEVVWMDDKGTVLSSEEYEYGQMPVYKLPVPEKEETETIRYEFIEWNKTITIVDGNQEYFAVFKETKKEFTIVWKDYDGTILKEEKYKYNDVPFLNGDYLKREGTEGYEYAFSGWSPEIGNVVKDQEYIAQYKSVRITYEVVWKNEDGSILVSDAFFYGDIPVFSGNEPTKESTLEYTYQFAGWSPDVSEVFSNQEYVAIFNKTKIQYKIEWLDEDGTLLEEEYYYYNDVPEYKGKLLLKDSTTEFSYEFVGWKDDVKSVVENFSYRAVFHATKRSYNVIWKNEDGTILYQNKFIYGTMPIYLGETPMKMRTPEFTYYFNDWDKEIDYVYGNQEYIATFTENTNQYEVQWLNADGQILDKENYLYGSMPDYKKEAPIKEKDVQFTYEFIGWTPEISKVSQNVQYTAVFKENIRDYQVVWKDYDGSILKIDSFPYGSVASFDAELPRREATREYSYTFSYWSPEIYVVNENQEYYANYDEVGNPFLVTWKNYDGIVLLEEMVAYGEVPQFTEGSIPKREKTVEFSYEFAGWSPEVSKVIGDIEYVATYVETKNSYLVIWKTENESMTAFDYVPYGEMPVYTYTEPFKIPTQQYSYSFIGWDHEIAPVFGDQVYIAVFEEKLNNYNVTWKNEDGKILKVDSFPYGTYPIYTGEEPTKDKSSEYTYYFSGWNKVIQVVTENQEYYALFSKKLNVYTVNFYNFDGSIFNSEKIEHGQKVTNPGSVGTKGYLFIGWYLHNEAYDFTQQVYDDLDIYSQWEKRAVYPERYVLASDEDFIGDSDGKFVYIGTKDYVIIPEYIKGIKVTLTGSINIYDEATYIFMKRKDIKGVAFEAPENILSASYLFLGNQSAQLELKYLDTSYVSYMNSMFYNSHIENINLGDLNTSNVISMEKMFYYCKAKTISFNGIDTSKVKNMAYMFAFTEAISIDISNLNTSSVTNMKSMFQGIKLSKIDLQGFYTSKVEDMSAMFYGLELEELNLDGFDTSKVKNMAYMFSECKINTLDLSSFDTSNVTSMTAMFLEAKIGSLDLSSFNTQKVILMNEMFKECNIEDLDISHFNTSNVFTMESMFENCTSKVLDVSNFDTSKVVYMQGMFRNTKALNINVRNFNTANVIDMSYMFYNIYAKYLYLNSFDTSKVKNMAYMFSECKINTLDLSSFDTSNVVSMERMFQSAKLTKLDLSNFNTSNVTNMSFMFTNIEIESLDLSSFDTSKVTNMEYMLYASEVTFVDLSSFDMRNVSNTKDIMNRDSSLLTGYARTIFEVTFFNNILNREVFTLKN